MEFGPLDTPRPRVSLWKQTSKSHHTCSGLFLQQTFIFELLHQIAIVCNSKGVRRGRREDKGNDRWTKESRKTKVKGGQMLQKDKRKPSQLHEWLQPSVKQH